MEMKKNKNKKINEKRGVGVKRGDAVSCPQVPVNKCGIMIVKEYGMYMIVILCYFVENSIYSILKYL